LATSVIFKKLPKENNHPIGESSPNLVTLPRTSNVWHGGLPMSSYQAIASSNPFKVMSSGGSSMQYLDWLYNLFEFSQETKGKYICIIKTITNFPRALAAWSIGIQGCQMVDFHTKNNNFGIFLEGLGIENVGVFHNLL
jgi:hypothetical protein